MYCILLPEWAQKPPTQRYCGTFFTVCLMRKWCFLPPIKQTHAFKSCKICLGLIVALTTTTTKETEKQNRLQTICAQKKADKEKFFYNSLLRWNDVAAGTEQQAAFFFLTRHKMSDKHWGDILTLKMQYPSRRECGATTPAGVLEKRRRRKNHKAKRLCSSQHPHQDCLMSWNQWILR